MNDAYAYDYNPSYSSQYGMYDASSTFTQAAIDSSIQKWLEAEYPELYDFETGNLNAGYGGGGNVARGTIGGFDQDPTVYAEIEAAANKYGVPANLLKAVITRESWGDWANNSRSVASVRGGKPIFGYVGVFFDAAESWGFDPATLEGNRAGQIEMLASGLKGFYDRSPNKSWEQAVSMHFSGNWNPTGYVDELGNEDSAYTNQVISWWKADDAATQAQGGTVGQGGTATSGLGSPDSPDWQPVNRWDSLVSKYAAQYNVPANLIKSVMRLESTGNPNAGSVQGATGLMQVMPDIHGYTRQQLLDPETNIRVGVSILRNNYDRWGSWEDATKAYLAGVPNSTAVDANGTGVADYWNRILGFWDQLDTGVQSVGQGPGQNVAPGAVTQMGAIWGNATNPDGSPFPVTQEFGPTPFSLGEGAWMYEYSVGLLGTYGHPALDIGMPIGTRLYTPMAGTVVVAGGSGSYLDDNYQNTPQTGELRIQLDNGHQIVLGHTSAIHVTVGQRLEAGQYVGLSGTANGPHVHVEYVVPDTSMSSGWRAVDPREALAGLFTGQLSGGQNMGAPGVGRPYTYNDLMRAGAMGQTIFPGLTSSANGGTWNSWLQRAMSGQIPSAFGPGIEGGTESYLPGRANGTFNGYTGTTTPPAGASYTPVRNPYRWY